MKGRSNVTHGNCVFRVANKRCQALQLRSPISCTQSLEKLQIRGGEEWREGERLWTWKKRMFCVCAKADLLPQHACTEYHTPGSSSGPKGTETRELLTRGSVAIPSLMSICVVYGGEITSQDCVSTGTFIWWLEAGMYELHERIIKRSWKSLLFAKAGTILEWGRCVTVPAAVH